MISFLLVETVSFASSFSFLVFSSQNVSGREVGQTERRRPSSWVPPQTRSWHRAPPPDASACIPLARTSVTVEELAKQWPSSAWQRFRLLEGHKGPLVADFLVLRAVLPRDRLPGPEIWVVIRRKVSDEDSEPEWKF